MYFFFEGKIYLNYVSSNKYQELRLLYSGIAIIYKDRWTKMDILVIIPTLVVHPKNPTIKLTFSGGKAYEYKNPGIFKRKFSKKWRV